MTFQDLHELLRLELVRRIQHGPLSGRRIAQQAGFQQAHISNFLNSKRALSLEGLDRVLASQNITIEQIIHSHSDPHHPLTLHGEGQAITSPEPVETIPVVSPSTAMDAARIHPSAILETIQVDTQRLHDNRPHRSAKPALLPRFIAIRADAQQAAAMEPLLAPGAIAVLDRHYTSLAPYRPHQRTLFAVRSGVSLLLRFIELDAGNLILRPYSMSFPIQTLPLAHHQSPADYIVGRVCLIISEL